MSDEKQQEKTRRAATLADLTIANYTVELEFEDGEILEVEMRELSFKQWQELGYSVTEPGAPHITTAKGGKTYDYNDPPYLQLRAQANDRRNILRLAAAMVEDVPGETVEEKADYLAENLDPVMLGGLLQAVYLRGEQITARVVERAGSFHGSGSNGNAGAGTQGLDDSPLEDA